MAGEGDRCVLGPSWSAVVAGLLFAGDGDVCRVFTYGAERLSTGLLVQTAAEIDPRFQERGWLLGRGLGKASQWCRGAMQRVVGVDLLELQSKWVVGGR